MVMGKCPECKMVLCDPQLYYKAKGEKRGSLQMKITCPSCGYVNKLKEFLK